MSGDRSPARAPVFRLATLVIAGAARLVPRARRVEWRREWDAELWYRVAALSARGALDAPEQLRLLRRCLGAYRHALWVLTHDAAADVRESPARSALAVAAVSLALGAGALAFSLADRATVGAAPFPVDGRAVRVFNTAPAADLERTAVSRFELARFRAENHSFEALAGFRRARFIVETGLTRLPVRGARVTPEWFRAVGVAPFPVEGAGTTRFETAGDSVAIAVIREDLWRDLTDARGPPHRVRVDGRPLMIVGVVPTHFGFPDPDTQLWTPLPIAELSGRVGDRRLAVVGRLRPGVSAHEAGADLRRLSLRLQADHPEGYLEFYQVPWSVEVVPLDALPREQVPMVGFLFAAAVILVIGAGSGVGMLRPAAHGRQAWTVVPLGTAAVAAGVVLFGLPVLSGWSVVKGAGYLIGSAALAGVLARLARGTRRDAALVALAVTAAVLLLAGAGLLAGLYRRVLQATPGFDPAGLVAVRTTDGGVDGDLARRAAEVPGIVAASLVSSAPLLENPPSGTIEPERGLPEGSPPPGVEVRLAAANYFEVMGIPLVAGRTFAKSAGPPGEVIVNRALADRFWPGAPALGQRLRVQLFGAAAPLLTVVAVAANVRTQGVEARPVAEVYLPPGPGPLSLTTLVVRTRLGPEAALAALRSHGAIGPRAFAVPAALEELARHRLAPYRDGGRLLGAAAVIAGLIAILACAAAGAHAAVLGAGIGGVVGVAGMILAARAVEGLVGVSALALPDLSMAASGVALAMLAVGRLLRRRLALL